MYSFMSSQMSCLAKGLVTMLALKWLLTSVYSFMSFQISCHAQRLVTLFTLKRLPTSVFSFMSFQISHHSKRLVILFALNRLLTSVSSIMCFRISWWWVNSSSECLHLTLLSFNVLISLSLDQYIKASFWDFPVMTEWTRLTRNFQHPRVRGHSRSYSWKRKEAGEAIETTRQCF